jgi:CDP-paratose 2-epimerase
MQCEPKQNGHVRPTSDPQLSAVLITGGAGFIGTNVADRMLKDGYRVTILDNLSREGVRQNVAWLQQRHGRLVTVVAADVRDPAVVRRAVENVSHVFHFAAQVAVTTSLLDPRNDFETNVTGTLNVLEAIRARNNRPSLIYTSTNKVYGGLEDVDLRADGCRYAPVDRFIAQHGISEARPLDFHTPYGCSKGAAEQYVRDYARSYGLRTVVFRMSCIYGPHQFGTEDQGWVAHFLIRALAKRPITIYGDGLQVRDILFIDDLMEAFFLAWRQIDALSGQAFNIGGGVARAVSLLELVDLIGRMTGHAPGVRFEPSRSGDQRYYVTDAAKFRQATGWSPKVSPQEGLQRLHSWLLETRHGAPVELAVS